MRSAALFAFLLLSSSSAHAEYPWAEVAAVSGPAKAVHVNELKDNIDDLRFTCGVTETHGAYAWPAIFPATAAKPILGAHVNALRDALKTHYSAKGLAAIPGNSVWGVNVGEGETVKARFIQDLRVAVDNAAMNTNCCTCGPWSDSACGGSCPPHQMQQARSCNRAHCAAQLQCVPASTEMCGGVCGAFGCQPGENCTNCPQDCGVCCGNGQCSDEGENCTTCPQDCGSCCVSDGSCSAAPACGETAQGMDNCGDPCQRTGPSCCGNGICSGGETCDTCPFDCGVYSEGMLSEWSACSAPCGSGESGVQTRTCNEAACGGDCNDAVITRSCECHGPIEYGIKQVQMAACHECTGQQWCGGPTPNFVGCGVTTAKEWGAIDCKAAGYPECRMEGIDSKVTHEDGDCCLGRPGSMTIVAHIYCHCPS